MLNPSTAARAQGILWTRPHLAELCDSIRQSIEALAGEDGRADAPQLDVARAHGHQIADTLDTLNVDGAARLARALAAALEQLTEDLDEDQATTVLEAVAILPNYLERLETGAPDTPEVLAERIADLNRIAGRDEPATAPSAGDMLDALDPGAPPVASTADPEALRRAWQRALRDWLMNPAESGGLVAVTEDMTRTDIPSIRRVGTAAGATFAALAGDMLDASPEINKRLAGIDGLLRQWSVDGAGDTLDAAANATARDLFEHLKQARPGLDAVDRLVAGSDGEPAGADNEELERARSVLSGRNRELFTAVAEAARGELNQAKDALNATLLGGSGDAPDIKTQTALLQSVAQSLGMLGLNRLAERVNTQAGRLVELTGDPDSPVLLDVARELLLVDSELEESVLYLGEAPHSELLEGDGEHLPKAEHRRVMRQLLNETLDDLSQAKHLLDQLHRGQGDPESPEQAHGTLERLAGVLRMAGLDEAAELVEASARSVREELIDQDAAQADRERLDALAEALIVTEFYLDSLTRLDDRGPEYLQAARRNLAELGYLQIAAEAGTAETPIESGDAAAGQPSAEAADEPPVEEPAASEDSDGFDAEHFAEQSPEEPSMESTPEATTAASAADESAEDEAPDGGLEFDLGTFTGSAERPDEEEGSETTEPAAADEPPADESGFDFEHFDLDDEAETEASGATAEEDAETGTDGLDFEGFEFEAEPSEDEEAAPAYDGPTLEFDTGAAMEPTGTDQPSTTEPEAEEPPETGQPSDETAQDEPTETEPEPAAEAEPETPAAPPEPATTSVGGDDFDLTEIFLEEFDEVLETLGEAYPRWREQLGDSVTLADIRRSFHTLKGSGRMAGAEEIGEFSWAFEQVLNRTIDDQFRAEDVVDIVGEAIAALPSLRNRLVGEPAELDEAGAQALVLRAERLGSEQALPELEGLDDQLVQLMIKEIGDHVETIDGWINKSRQQGWAAPIDRDLIRSVHTIKGTLRLAPIGDEADSMQLIEEHLQELADTEAEPSDDAITLIEDMRAMLGKRLDRLNHQAVSTDHFQTAHLTEQARSLISALHRRRDADEAAWSEEHAALEDEAASDETIVDLEAENEALDDIEDVEIDAEEPTAEVDEEIAEDHAETEALSDETLATGEIAETSEANTDREIDATDEFGEPIELESEDELGADLEATEGEALAAEAEAEAHDEADPESPAELETDAEPVAEQADFEPALDDLPPDAAVDADEEAAELEETAAHPEPEAGLDAEAEAEAETAPELDSESEPAPDAEPEAPVEIREPARVEFESWPESQVGELDHPDEAPDDVAAAEAAASAGGATVGTIAVDYASLDEELVDLFAEEGQELLEHADDLLQQWRENPEDRGLVTALQRDVHTIKGSARMAGLNPIGEVAHVLEDLLENIAGGREQSTSERIDTLETGCDHLHGMVDAVTRREALPARPAGETLAADDDSAEALETVAEPMAEASDDASTQRASTIRLASERVEELLNFAGEISIFRSRIEQEFGSYRGNISEVEQTVARLRDQLRKLEAETEAQILSRYEREHGPDDEEFDPLELDRYSTIQQLSRALAESVSDLNSLTELMDNTGRQAETLLMQQARVTTELQEGLMQARMVAFTTLAPRLRRVVRNAARDAERKAELEILAEGEGELDRNVLDRMTAPIEHILRNAIAHGIESPADRRAAGKPETGRILIEIDREATELLIRVSDDGAGLNLERIRERALAQGLLTDAQADDPEELSQVILRAGFSTAHEVSELAGRGVGMDVVSSEVRQVGGRISVHSDTGQGTRFTLRIPLSLAVMQAIFVQAAERLFAIPLQSVRGVARIRPEEWQDALEGDGLFRYGGQDYPLLELEPQLGFEPDEQEEGISLSLLMISTGDQRAAIRVTEIQGHREIVLKPVGPQISSIPGILGGTIMGDGNVVVLLDMAPLIDRAIREQRLPGMVERHDATAVESEEIKRAPLVMVIDDSITMRRVTSRILENNGMEVLTARDGIEAVDLLLERVPDLMLLDIEMPRMDGFELAGYVREDARLKDVPIMMITSRSGDKHRERAKQLGVNRYLIKPYQEANLMRNVFEMLELPDPEA